MPKARRRTFTAKYKREIVPVGSILKITIAGPEPPVPSSLTNALPSRSAVTLGGDPGRGNDLRTAPAGSPRLALSAGECQHDLALSAVEC